MIDSVIWAIAAFAFFVIEAMTTALITIWFAVGALIALLISFFCKSIAIQIAVFIIISLVTLFACYPILKEGYKPKFKTNLDSLIGKECIVIEGINNIEATGKIQVSGQIWTARSSDGTIIQKNTLVKIEQIEGVKMIVSKIGKENPELSSEK